jgi:hypothetical protein
MYNGEKRYIGTCQSTYVVGCIYASCPSCMMPAHGTHNYAFKGHSSTNQCSTELSQIWILLFHLNLHHYSKFPDFPSDPIFRPPTHPVAAIFPFCRRPRLD